MYPLVESVRIENRQLYNIELHNRRINAARAKVYGQYSTVDIAELINPPPYLTDERYKCRIIFYHNKTDVKIAPYIQREIRTLKIVFDDTIDYTYKSEKREKLDAAFAQREGCDDVIIVRKGFLTDSWAANIILFDGEKWVTPDTPLLKGIQREFLLQQGLVEEQTVRVDDIIHFSKIKLINAMIDFERAPEIEISTGVFH